MDLFHQQDPKLMNSWNRNLYLWWEHYNEEYLGGALKRPRVALSYSEVELGSWDSGIRSLTISVRHIEADPWTSVMDTLRHEIAHQYVAEVLGVNDEKPHGTAFRRACEKLRCEARASSTLSSHSGQDGPEDAVLQRLKKLLKLSKSPNEHEAQAAMEKARLLLVKYNIDLVELDRQRSYASRYIGPVKGRHTSAELWLSTILSDFFFVEVIWSQSYDASRDRAGTILQLFGTPQNLEMADYVYHYLTDLLGRIWGEYKETNELTGNRERQRYYAGVLEGFHRKLQKQEKTLEKSHALVWKGDQKLTEFYRHHNPRIEIRYGGGGSPTRVYRDGLEQGRNVSIRNPVPSRSKSFGGYLTP